MKRRIEICLDGRAEWGPTLLRYDMEKYQLTEERNGTLTITHKLSKKIICSVASGMWRFWREIEE